MDNIKNEIKIPVDLDKYILNGMKDGKEILRKEKRKQNKKMASIVAMLVLILTSSTVIIKPEVVSAIPIIGRVFEYFIEDYKEYPMKKYQEMGKVVGQTIDKDGNKITLDQMVIDNNIFVASIIVQSDKLNEIWSDNERIKNMNHMSEEIRINGTEILCTTSVKLLNDKKAMVILSSNTSNLKLDEEVNIDISLNSISNIKNEEIVGPWEFNIKALNKIQSKELIINEKLDLEAGDIFIEKVNISPISTKIYISGKHIGGEKGREKMDLLKYSIKDNEGNKLDILYGESIISLDGNYRIQLDITSDLSNAKFIELAANNSNSKVNDEESIIIKLKN